MPHNHTRDKYLSHVIYATLALILFIRITSVSTITSGEVMMSSGSFAADSISLADFKTVQGRYNKHVKKELRDLDEYRYIEMPNEIASRWQMRDDLPEDQPILLMSKGELVQLVTWKLKHGTFRPKLQQLVESNDEQVVHKLMQDLSLDNQGAKEKMQMLTKLKGIGPATASLVLSVISPTRFPFFSDELFRWIHWDGKNADGTNAGIKSGKGWARPIGYTQKEYDSLIAKCEQVQKRLSMEGSEKLSFLALEQVAYVLGQEKAEIQAPGSSIDSSSRKRRSDQAEIAAQQEATEEGEKARSEPIQKGTGTSRSKRRKQKAELRDFYH